MDAWLDLITALSRDVPKPTRQRVCGTFFFRLKAISVFCPREAGLGGRCFT